ncbi:hypothetical protein ILUMI_12068, partial [Ignelater luminosus]
TMNLGSQLIHSILKLSETWVTDSFDPEAGSVSKTKESWICDSSEDSGAVVPEEGF